MNFVGKLQNEYESLWKQIIRPPRAHYSEEALGPHNFVLEGVQVERKDFQMTNIKDNKFQGSLWLPSSSSKTTPCVLYLHSSGGNRTEGMEYLGKLIRSGLGLCTFDFGGCGNAEGEYISMGYFEQQEVSQVIEYLKSLERVGPLCLWGKQMGAVSAMLALSKTLEVKAVVLDCAFKNLKAFIEDSLKTQLRLPSLVIGGTVKIISKTIEEKAGFDINNVNPYKFSAPGLHIPALFAFVNRSGGGESEDDKKLFDAYGGHQKSCFLLGEKQRMRNEDYVNNCTSFLLQFLELGQKQSAREFDFFQCKDRSQKLRKENREEKEEPKKSKDFSLKGILSFFGGEAQDTELPQVAAEDLHDGFSELRREIEMNSRPNQRTLKKGGGQVSVLLSKMRKEGGDRHLGKLEGWVFCDAC